MSTKGPYRIQTVAEITGVPAATLRAWERRYGVPAPMRTASAYRLYDEQDVEVVTRLRDLCAKEGMAPAEAARLLRETGETPEADAVDANPFAVARDRLVAAVDRFDPDAFEGELRHALCLGSAVVVFERILAPALREIGDRWHAGRLGVAQEHVATEQIVGATRDLLRLMQPDAANTVLLACIADEEHVVPLLGVALRFAQWGFRVILLGARTPPDAVEQARRTLDPTLIGLSVTVLPTRPRARELAAAYGAACGDTPWLVGGAAAESMRPLVEAAGGAVSDEDMGTLQVRVKRMLAGRRISRA